MTDTIQITRHYNPANMADRFRLGNNEHEGNAFAREYKLPRGYRVDALAVYDPAGYECAIVLGNYGGPKLISMAGNCPDYDLKPV